MSKTFKYTKITKICGDEQFGEEFEYEVSEEELLEAVACLVFENYFKNTELCLRCDYVGDVRKALKRFINDNDNLEDLVEDYEDELKEMFEDEAFDSLD